MNSVDIAYWRMHNLRLVGDPFEAPEDVVHWLGAVQSQDFGPAKWSVAASTSGVSDATMDQAYANGAILRTHILRPTWHFVLPADIRWMLDATAARVHALNAYRYRQLELEETLLKRCSALLVDALEGGNHLTRKEIGATLESTGIATGGQRLAYILMYAELNGIICSGAPKGRQHTYALLDERAPQAKRLDYDEALAELTRRYFTSHGPATARDFRSWASLRAADVKRGLDMVGAQLERVVIDGRSYWYAESPPQARPVSPTVHLLQAYDEYFMGYSESRHVIDVSGVTRTPPQGAVVFNGVVILDTQVAGHWKRTMKKDSVIIEATLYTSFNDAQSQALQAAADRLGEFLSLPATVARTGV